MGILCRVQARKVAEANPSVRTSPESPHFLLRTHCGGRLHRGQGYDVIPRNSYRELGRSAALPAVKFGRELQTAVKEVGIRPFHETTEGQS